MGYFGLNLGENEVRVGPIETMDIIARTPTAAESYPQSI